MYNQPMAGRQKAIELEKVALLKKMKEIVENPPCEVDRIEKFQSTPQRGGGRRDLIENYPEEVKE